MSQLQAEAQQQARAEGLTLLKADNKVGYFGVHHKPGHPKPYERADPRGGGMREKICVLQDFLQQLNCRSY